MLNRRALVAAGGYGALLVQFNIAHTVRYTELSPTRFKDFWRN
jgi:hypothetical protein